MKWPRRVRRCPEMPMWPVERLGSEIDELVRRLDAGESVDVAAALALVEQLITYWHAERLVDGHVVLTPVSAGEQARRRRAPLEALEAELPTYEWAEAMYYRGKHE